MRPGRIGPRRPLIIAREAWKRLVVTHLKYVRRAHRNTAVPDRERLRNRAAGKLASRQNIIFPESNSGTLSGFESVH